MFPGILFVLSLLTMSAFAGGDWPMWRRDSSITAYQPMPGAMTKEPRVLAKHFVGTAHGATTFADLLGSGEKKEVLVTARARLTAYTAKGKKLWESAPEGYVLDHLEWVEDLDGDGSNEVIAIAHQMGFTRQAYLILDAKTGKKRAAIEINTGDFSWRGSCGAYQRDKKGKQIFIVTSTRKAMAPPTFNGEFALWSFDGEKVKQEWSWVPTEYHVEYPAMLIGDLGDGRGTHAVVNAWSHIWNIDLATGKPVSFATWDPQGANKRHYGWNELIDATGDGKLDLVTLSLTKHVDVLRNVDGKLELAWTRGWPDPVTTEVRSLHAPSDPVTDLDGDGKMELITGLFDGVIDQKWHLYIFNAATGEQKIDALDLVPIASVPLWGTNKGRALLCVRSSSVSHEPAQAYEAWQLRGTNWTKLWSSTNETFVLKQPEATERRVFYFNALKSKSAVTSDVDADGKMEFFTQGTGANAPQAWGLNADGAITAKQGKPSVTNAPALPKNIPPFQGTMVPYLLAADLDGTKPNEILLYNNTEVTALRMEKKKLRVVEKFPSSEIPVVCDLVGDGKPYVLTSGSGADKNLWIEARAADKQILWRFVFPDSSACGQYSERPLFYIVGHFTGGKHLDILTYATKPSARTYVLDGRTGKIVWERVELPEIQRHFHPLGGRVSSWDYNKDGADDVVFTNPDYYCVADGKTGKLLVGPVELQGLMNWWAAYASPATLPQVGQEPIVYMGGAYSSRGTISLDGKRSLWCEYLPTERWPLRSGNSGFNEGLLPPSRDRGWRGAQMEADGTIVCFDVATGKHLWKMQIPTATTGIISGDVDGNGEPEFLFGGQDGKLLAVRDAGDHGEIIWRKTFDGPVGTPIIADVNADGVSEIVVTAGDGFVYVLGK